MSNLALRGKCRRAAVATQVIKYLNVERGQRFQTAAESPVSYTSRSRRSLISFGYFEMLLTNCWSMFQETCHVCGAESAGGGGLTDAIMRDVLTRDIEAQFASCWFATVNFSTADLTARLPFQTKPLPAIENRSQMRFDCLSRLQTASARNLMNMAATFGRRIAEADRLIIGQAYEPSDMPKHHRAYSSKNQDRLHEAFQDHSKLDAGD